MQITETTTYNIALSKDELLALYYGYNAEHFALEGVTEKALAKTIDAQLEVFTGGIVDEDESD